MHELGIQQGTIISCDGDFLKGDIKHQLMNGRAIEAMRNKPVSESDLIVALSQDCDLANADDKYIEVIPIRAITGKKFNVLQQRSRNYRKLQLSYDGRIWLLESDKIAVIPKNKLPITPEADHAILDDRNLQLVIDWRIGRYKRRPLPHNFNLAFVGHLRDDPELSAYLEENREVIFDFYVHVDPMIDEYADEYRVTVTALIDQECSDEKESEIQTMLRKHWAFLHERENCLKMWQVDNSLAPETLDISSEITARLADFSFLDNALLTKVTLEFLCYDDPDEAN